MQQRSIFSSSRSPASRARVDSEKFENKINFIVNIETGFLTTLLCLSYFSSYDDVDTTTLALLARFYCCSLCLLDALLLMLIQLKKIRKEN